MPKRLFTFIPLPAIQPDCCADCPLCGLVPKGLRPKGSYETHVCMGTMEALGGRFVKVHASKRDSKHPLHRPCDNKWHAWVQLPSQKLPISTKVFNECRTPYEASKQLKIKFHK